MSADATPVLYGVEHPGLTLQRPQPRLDTQSPAAPDRRIDHGGHEHFVGRTWELAGLGADFIGSSSGAEVKPVALITGLGGMGKTALTAEALALWESRFEWVLLYQAAECARLRRHAARHPPEALCRAGSLPRSCAGTARRCHLPGGGGGVHRRRAAGAPDAQSRPRPAR